MADCAFLLLFYFIVTSMSSPHQNKALKLPAAPYLEVHHGKKIEIIIKGEQYFVNNKEYTFKQLSELLENQNVEKEILISAEKEISFREIKKILLLLQKKEITNIHFKALESHGSTK